LFAEETIVSVHRSSLLSAHFFVMKINEKTLACYASGKEMVDMEGLLWKRGEVNKAFQRRWCTLRGNLLFYSEKKGDKEPLGVIILEGCTVELAEEETDHYAFKLVFHTEGRTGRTYVLGASSQAELERWMKLLACASYDFMKLMVVELQHKINQIESGGSGERDKPGEPRPPPRARHNPFNTNKEKDKRSWLDLHKFIGESIVKDREDWLKGNGDLSDVVTTDPVENIKMSGDNLLIVL